MDISILVVCHHDRGYLEQAMRSARRQDFRGSFEVVLQQSDKTMAQNHNIGFKRCKGEYVKWLHDDDMLTQNCLTDLWTQRGADVICANAFNFHEDKEDWLEDWETKSTIPKDMIEIVERYNIHAGTLMYKRQVLLDNPLDESLWTAEDYELNMRLFSKGAKFAHVDKVVSKYRVHSGMKSFPSYGNVTPERYIERQDEKMRIQDMYAWKLPR